MREFGRPDETVAIYQQVLAKSPRDAAAHLGLANELRAQGRHNEAVAEYREAIRLKRDYVMAHNNLADTLLMHPDPAKREPALALEHARKATALEPRNRAYVNTLAMAQHRAGLRDLALASFRKSMELANGGDPNDWFFVAIIEHQRGNADLAARWFDKSVAWMKQQKTPDAGLVPIWTEAAQVLGGPGPEAVGQQKAPDPKSNP